MESFKGVGNFENGRIDGVVTFPGGVYGDLNINGVATAEGPLDAGVMDIDGVFNARSDVNCKTLNSDGVSTIDGNLRCSLLDVDGVVTVHGSKIEADRIVCDGVISIEGQVSADNIDANGFINATEIVGDRISIQSYKKSIWFKLWVKINEAVGSQNYSRVGLIEATTINLRGVYATKVSGHDITIGPGCKIDTVDASGPLYIDIDAEVATIIGAVSE